VLDHADRGDRVELLAGEVAVVGEADLDPVGEPGRASATCGSDTVMPVTWTPYSPAACSAKLPHPQPTSSTRSPAHSLSFVHTSSSFARCAASSVWAPREKIAHEYVIDSPRISRKNSFEMS
jgi:hypothetical protein